MKKRIFCLFLAFLALALSACGKKEEEQTATGEAFTPLFRFVIQEGGEKNIRLFSMPESDGFFYLHPAAEGGFSGGFVSVGRSISSESVIRGNENVSFALVRENAEDRATLVSDAGISYLLLKENSADTKPLPEEISFENAIFYDDLTLLAESEELLLLCPVDLSAKYVLAEKKSLPDYAAPLAVTHEGQQIWYALKGEEEGSYGGFASFEYGKTEILSKETFPFHEFYPIGSTGVLFVRHLDDGGALYLYRDLEKKKGGSYTADKPFEGVTCSADGTVLCGTYSQGATGTVLVCSLATGKSTATYTVDFGAPCPSLALSSDGSTLLLAVMEGKEEIVGTLNLSLL